MKRLFILLVVCLFISGCGLQTGFKHLQSTVTGLDRRVCMYSATGEVIRSWTGRYKVEDNGGSISFVNLGKTIIVAGSYTVEEL